MRRPILTAAVLLLTACGTDQPSVPPTLDPSTAAPASAHLTTAGPVRITADALIGREFWSTSLTGRDLVLGSRVSLRFRGGKVLEGGAACNYMGGTWSLDGTTLHARFGVTTEMWCGALRHAQEVWVGEFISSDPTASIDGDELVLTDDGVTMTLLDREVADPDRPLAGTPWTLTALEPEGAPVDLRMGVPDGVHASFVVEGERPMIRIDTGCNTGQATVTMGDGTMSMGPLALTRRDCLGDAAWVERQMTTVLQGDVAFEIEGRALDVSSAGGFLSFETE